MIYTRNIKGLPLDHDLKIARSLCIIHYSKSCFTLPINHCKVVTLSESLFNVLGQRQGLKNLSWKFSGCIWATGTIATFGVASMAAGRNPSSPLTWTFCCLDGSLPFGINQPWHQLLVYFGFKPTRTLYYKYSVPLRYKMYKYYKLKQTWLVKVQPSPF